MSIVIQRNLAVFAFLFGLICGGPVFGQSEGVRLQWKWNVEDKLLMKMEQQVDTKAETDGRTIDSRNTTCTWIEWNVTDVDKDGTGTINSKVTRITVDAENPMGKAKFDSDVKVTSPASARLARNLEPMVGGISTQKISKRGEVLEVEIGDDLESSLDRIGGETSVEMFRELARNATLVLPEHPLKTGDSWEKKLVTMMPQGEITLLTTYTYAGKTNVESRDLHQFDVKVVMDFSNESVKIESQQTTGAMYFDADAGRLDHSKVEQSVEMTVSRGGKKTHLRMEQVATVRVTSH